MSNKRIEHKKDYMQEVTIIENNEDWIVVNKPSGLSVHNKEDSTNLIEELKKIGFDGFHAVNRLDKETSGLMLLSNDSKLLAELQLATGLDTTSKTYLGIVRGCFKAGDKIGKWNDPITNKAEGRKNPLGVKSQRVNATTHYEVLNSNKYLSYVQFKIETGRQHQIRKHCIINKHEVLGDKRYGDKKYNNLINKQYDNQTMTLHAHKLSFMFRGKRHKYTSLPPEDWSLFELNS
jgi:tRNA pseudouridine65 synthase